MINTIKKLYFKIINALHYPFVRDSTNDPYHVNFQKFISLCEQKSTSSILEIGSRNVTGITRKSLFPWCCDYVGFDIHAGEGVDIVGDVHKLSQVLPIDHFDFVYSISVFEHLLLPWKAVLEINKVMKKGGYIFISTHPIWPEHEEPWDFWRFPQNSFHALFNQYTGFEIIALNEGLPCKTYSLVKDFATRGLFFSGRSNLGVSLIARKVGEVRSDLLKWDIDISDVLDTTYPTLSTVVHSRYSGSAACRSELDRT